MNTHKKVDICCNPVKYLCHKLRDLKCYLGYHYTGHFYFNHGFQTEENMCIPYICDNCDKTLVWSVLNYKTNTSRVISNKEFLDIN